MGLDLGSGGRLVGRVLQEAIVDGPAAPAVSAEQLRSPAVNGRQLLLQFQEVGRTRYLDQSCIVAAGQTAGCR